MQRLTVKKTASKGIAIGKAYKVNKKEPVPAAYQVDCIDSEIMKYEAAVKLVSEEIEELAKTNEIYEAHRAMVQDVSIYEGVTDRITNRGMNAQQALQATINEFWTLFDGMEDEYMRERAGDIKDIGKRLLLSLKGDKEDCLDPIGEQVILVAEELGPSDTAKFNLDYILGFLTERGGVTSHVCIMARSIGLPALVGVEGLMDAVESGDTLILDAEEGIIIIQPTQDEMERYLFIAEEKRKKQADIEAAACLPAVTKDGHTVRICANIGSIEDLRKALNYNIDGVGLFRSEFLYMENEHFPDEEEQYKVYRQAAELCPQELIIRTLDIGGDKELPYYKFDPEENPFLGWRAIRISLDLPQVFKTQLRAILRASALGNVKIMYPMMISAEELSAAGEILEECKKELDAEGVRYNKNLQTGMMIETPAAVLCAEYFAKHADFFSIGTNDLTQYILAVDRGNQRIALLYNTLQPAVLRAIKHIIDAGHSAGIPVGMCGEFAGDERAVRLLLGLGLDEFSVSAREAPMIKSVVRNSYYEAGREIAEKVVKEYDIGRVMEWIEVINRR